MTPQLARIYELIMENGQLTHAEKDALAKAIADADKQWAITEFKLERTEKVKKTAAILLDETIAELEHKRKAVEDQKRELEVEGALERVRTMAMAMQKPEEIRQVAELLRKEMARLGVEELETSSIYITDTEKDKAECWYAIKDVRGEDAPLVSDEMTLDLRDTWVGRQMLAFMDSPDEKTSILMKGAARKEWINYCSQRSGVLKGYYGDDIPERTYHLYKFAYGYVGAASPGHISDESWNLLKRVAAVFSFAYTRFLDLQDAEARSREAHIELALERIRARTMAMQHSEELKDVIRLVLDQFLSLSIHVDHSGFYIDYKTRDDMHIWLADPNQVPAEVFFPYFDTPTWNSYREAIAEGKSFFTNLLDFDEKNKFYTELFELVPVPKETKDFYLNCKGLAVSTVLLDNVGLYIENVKGVPYTDEENAILMRIGKVFQQTYTRFCDLKIAEDHARQAEQDLLAIRDAKLKAEEALTELKATQQQLIQSEKMASLGELTAGIAHEIQNPLNFVNNFSEINAELTDEISEALDKDDKETAKALVADIRANQQRINEHGKRAEAIVRGMLQHSRTGSGAKEPTNLNALADEYLRLAFHGFRAKDKSFNASFVTSFDPGMGSVDLVPQDIGRVLLNLINNAFYAVNEKAKTTTLPYEPTVTIETRRLEKQVLITVSDNGSGIPPALKEKIFQPFFTTKPTGQGTGLGLSLCYDIVKAHGGKLEVESKEGEGATFRVMLPSS